MAALTSTNQFLEVLRKSKLLDEKRLDEFLAQLSGGPPDKPRALAEALFRQGLVTHFQANNLLQGKWRGYRIAGDKYKLLELLGVGGMGTVYLCEHERMKRLVALKVLPKEKLEDPSTLERFEREARAVAALNHPNLVRAYDLDIHDKNLHFLVMEFVDGTSLQDIVKKFGPMDVVRAAHYISQVAEGLQHAHETAGLVHRDIKPGNILLDRSGTVKILDMGLARFFHDDANPLTKKYEKNAVLGTADYLAPEQAVNSSDVDIRADIYSLGATFYFLLTGRSPFDEGSVPEKLIWHQMKNPESVRVRRPEVPKEMEAVLIKMMAKKPVHRYQEPAAIVEALRPWTEKPVEPPADEEMPRLCPALENYSPSGAPLPSSNMSGNLSGLRRPMRSGPRSASYARVATSRLSLAGRPRPRWLYPAVGAAALLVVGAAVAYWSMTRDSSRGVPNPKSAPVVQTPAKAPKVETPPAPPTPPLPADAPATPDGRLYVSRKASANHIFETLAAALAAAQPGQTILVLENDLEEQLRLDGRKFPDVRIESGLPAGQRVVWKAPANLSADQPLIDLTAPAGVVLKGFFLDGDKRANTLIRATGDAAGLTFDDLHMVDALKTSVVFDGCTSSKDKPVAIQGTRIETVRNYAQGDNLEAEANADAVRPAAVVASGEAAGVLHLAVNGCRIEGLFNAGVRLEVPCEAEVKLNRFYTLKADKRPRGGTTCSAVSVKVPASGAVKLTIASNTAARYSDLLRLDRVPEADSGSKFELRSNLMIGGDAFVSAPPGTSAAAAKPLFAGSLGNVARPRTCDGGLKVIDKVEVSFGYIDVNLPSANFLIYKKSGDTLPLFTAGAGGEPAGVPPRE